MLLFWWLLHWGVGGATPFPGFLHFTLDPLAPLHKLAQKIEWRIKSFLFFFLSLLFLILFIFFLHFSLWWLIFICIFNWILIYSTRDPVGWGSRMQRLHLCRGVIPHPLSECLGYGSKKSCCETEALGNAEYPFINITPQSTLPQNDGTSGGVMVSKLNWQTYTSKFKPHWLPHSYDLVLHLSQKKLSKLLLWLRMVAPNMVLFMGQIELFDIQTVRKWLKLNWIV